MRSYEDGGGADIVARAAAVASRFDLATLLRELRRREARLRRGRALTYRQIADQTGWGIGSVCEYFSGDALPPDDRFDELLRLLAARPAEIGALATARERLMAVNASGPRKPSAGQPRALPAAAHGFTGRRAQLAQLDRALADWAQAGPVVISAVAGMGGVGKTALALYWAHQVRERFPGGQLYVNLRGYDPGEPLSTVDALALLLADLGIDPDEPGDLDNRIARYRDLLAQRRALVVLDNARGVEQVRPLLPPPSCLALVTSRDDLTELATVDGATVLRLDVLSLDEAVALLRVLVGSRADREPEAVRALALRCGCLPLALRVAAEHVAFRQQVAIADLVAELDHDEEPLDALSTTGEARSDVRAVFSWSLRTLPAPAARVFRLLGLSPGVDIDRYALAALTGIDVDEADGLMQTLLRAHLAQVDGRERISMHDLLRAYATELAAQELDGDDRRAALTRLLDYYLAVAAAAAGLLFPSDQGSRPRPAWPAAAPRVDDIASASAWLAAERPNLARMFLYAAARS